MPMNGMYGPYSMSREASGTAWQPEAARHDGVHLMKGPWMLMLHGFADGLYDDQGRLIHVGQAGSGFDHKTLAHIWKLLNKLETNTNPFHGPVEALRRTHWVKPELVAEIQFSEWTHMTSEGGPKLRAPVFLGLRYDKDPKECRFDQQG